MTEKIYDVIIIGGGGAGLTAGLYASRANLSVLLFEKMMAGGQIASTDLVENYPGFEEGIQGAEVAVKMEAQAKRYGTEFAYDEVTAIAKKGDVFEIKTLSAAYISKTVILAMGASFKTLGIEHEKELIGKGISYCATCDGAFFRGKKVIVVGGGDSAVQEGLFLTRFAESVTIVHRRDSLRASPILQSRAKANPKIDFIWNAVVEDLEGADKLQAVVLKDTKTGAAKRVETNGVFVFIGHNPNSQLARNFVEVDTFGYIITADNTKQTSVKGVFAAGEVRLGATRQLVAACGEGCSAAIEAQQYLDDKN